jgi:hypothetical protein
LDHFDLEVLQIHPPPSGQDANETKGEVRKKNLLDIKYEKLSSNAHISTFFFQKIVFFSKIFFGKPLSKFFEVFLNSEYMYMC